MPDGGPSSARLSQAGSLLLFAAIDNDNSDKDENGRDPLKTMTKVVTAITRLQSGYARRRPRKSFTRKLVLFGVYRRDCGFRVLGHNIQTNLKLVL